MQISVTLIIFCIYTIYLNLKSDVNKKIYSNTLYFRVVATLIELGREIGCYKITLNCKDDLVKWYNGFGLKCEPGNANFMTIRIPNEPKSML